MSATAEKALIGAALSRPDDVLPDLQLKASSFSDRLCGRAYDALQKMWHQGTTIDPVVLITALTTNGNGDDIRTFVGKVYDIGSEFGGGWKEHARIVQEAAARREVERAARDIYDLATSGKDVQHIIEEAQSRILAVQQTGTRKGFAPIGDWIDTEWDDLRRKESGLPTGFASLDRLIGGLEPGGLIVLGARPGMGKSALAANIMRNNLRRGIPCAFLGLESNRKEMLMRLLSTETGIDVATLRRSGQSPIEGTEWTQLEEARETIRSWPLDFAEAADISTLEALLAESRRWAHANVAERGKGLIITDYLQLLERAGESENRAQEIGKISRSLKLLASQLEVPILALSQLNRSLEGRSDRRPRLSDLRESGSIEQDANIVLFLYRESQYSNTLVEGADQAELIIAKNRNGRQGSLNLRFVGETFTFS